MTEPLVVLGGGGNLEAVLLVIARMNAVTPTFSVVGVLDDAELDPVRLDRFGLSWLGPLDAAASLGVARFATAAGSPVARRAMVDAAGEGMTAPVLVDPSAEVGVGARLGPGTLLRRGCGLSPGVVLGAHTAVFGGAVVGHGSVLEDFATVMVGASVSGDCFIGQGAVIATNATVLPGTRVGAGATVGAGSVVTRDVPDGVTVAGTPAKQVRR